jgi:hypothetical protein
MTVITKELAAEAAHELIRLLQRANGEEVAPPWGEAPAWQQESTNEGIDLAIQGISPEENHDKWFQARTKAGWVWGPVKDPDASPPTNPTLVPYSQLSDLQKRKDAVFPMVVQLFLAPLAAPEGAAGA